MVITKATTSKDFQISVYNLITSLGYNLNPVGDEDIVGDDAEYPYFAYETTVNYSSNTLKYARLVEGQIVLLIADYSLQSVKDKGDIIIQALENANDFSMIGYDDNPGNLRIKSKSVYFNRLIIKVTLDGIR